MARGPRWRVDQERVSIRFSPAAIREAQGWVRVSAFTGCPTPPPERYDAHMSTTDANRMFQRQTQRADQAADWLRHLDLRAGERCADVGSGPGYFSLILAERVGPTGVVYAIDRSPEALAYLAEEMQVRGVANIQTVHGDAAAVDLPSGPADAAVVAMMLHHTSDPAGVLRNVARLLRPGGRAVVAEFHPEGTGEHGAPLSMRLPPEAVRAWCEAAGLEVRAEERTSPEHYLLSLRLRPPSGHTSPAGAHR